MGCRLWPWKLSGWEAPRSDTPGRRKRPLCLHPALRFWLHFQMCSVHFQALWLASGVPYAPSFLSGFLLIFIFNGAWLLLFCGHQRLLPVITNRLLDVIHRPGLEPCHAGTLLFLPTGSLNQIYPVMSSWLVKEAETRNREAQTFNHQCQISSRKVRSFPVTLVALLDSFLFLDVSL